MPVWTNRYDGPANRNDRATAMALDHYNNLIVTGDSERDAITCDFATLKYLVVEPPVLTGLQLTNGRLHLRLENLVQPGNLVIEASDGLTAWAPYSPTRRRPICCFTPTRMPAPIRKRLLPRFQSP